MRAGLPRFAQVRQSMKKTRRTHVKKESIVSALLIFTIVYSAGLLVFNPGVEAQPSEPTVIGKTDVFGLSYQRYTFYANARFWVFYSDNVNLVYTTSIDGSVWVSATAVRTASANPEFSVWFDGTYVHYAKGQKDQVPNTPLYYRMGVPNASGNITWNAPEQIVAPAVANRSYRAPQIITDSDGYPVITYFNKTTKPYILVASVIKSSTKNGTWTNAAGFPAVVSTKAAWPFSVPLKNSKLYTMWFSMDNAKTRGSLYNGAFWGVAADCTSNYNYDEIRGLSAVSYGDDVHLVYIENETATKIYRHVKRTYGSGWGPETVVKNVTAASGNSGSITLTVDSNNGDLWMWFNTTDNKIAYRKYVASTSSWDTNDTYPFGDSFTFPYYITTSYQVRNKKILAYWQEGTLTPYYLLFDYLTDTTAPTVSVQSPTNQTYAATTVALNFTVDEATSWRGYSLDGLANVTSGNTTLTSLLDGMHYVVVYANDTWGNMGASGTVYFTVDTAPPTVSILSPENKTHPVNILPLTFTVDETTTWIGYSLDSQANVTITGNTTLPVLSEGLHSVVVYANDTAGNMGASDTIIFWVDTTPPTGSITIAEDSAYTNTTSVALTLLATDTTSGVELMRFSNNGTTWSDWELYTTSKSWTLSTDDGMKTVYVQYRDRAGLISQLQDTIILDATQPTADADVNQTVAEDTLVTFDDSASTDENGIATYTWTFTDITPQTLRGENPTYNFTTPGTYIVTLSVEDVAGNTATDTVTITVLLDTDGDETPDVTDPDDDNDGVNDDEDAFPLDPTETVDTDGDGVGNNADTDDDNDGVLDVNDAFPLDPTESVDTDGDDVGDNADTDDDNDGVVDINDPFPLDPTESIDTDNDGVGNNADTDDDNDGVLDVDDAFPLDDSESVDTDGDGVGNNSDTDDDDDGMPDTWETDNELDPLNATDASLDPDGDGLTNLQEYQEDTDPNVSDAQAFPWWVLGAVAALMIGWAVAATFLWRRRKQL